MKLKIFFLAVFFTPALLNAQRLDRFAMSKFAAGGERGIAYPMQKSFFGILPTDSIRNYIKSDTTFYYIYLWLPKPVKELGVQLISPVPRYTSAWKGDYEAPDYHDSLKADGKYFDPVLMVRLLPNSELRKETFWNNIPPPPPPPSEPLRSNDNSDEAPVQPSLKKNNSLIRIGASETDTAYAAAGLYLILFKSATNKKPEGTFVIQVGATEVTPGLKLFRRTDELTESY